MPEVAITSVKENIARFENVIMKQVYNEAGADSTTTAQVIDEETGNVICECEAGGGGGEGGESDFKKAEVTITNLSQSPAVYSIYFNTEKAILISDNKFDLVNYNMPSGQTSTLCILGESVNCEMNPVDEGTTPTATGDCVITYDAEHQQYIATISGDCTITVNNSEGNS